MVRVLWCWNLLLYHKRCYLKCYRIIVNALGILALLHHARNVHCAALVVKTDIKAIPNQNFNKKYTDFKKYNKNAKSKIKPIWIWSIVSMLSSNLDIRLFWYYILVCKIDRIVFKNIYNIFKNNKLTTLIKHWIPILFQSISIWTKR